MQLDCLGCLCRLADVVAAQCVHVKVFGTLWSSPFCAVQFNHQLAAELLVVHDSFSSPRPVLQGRFWLEMKSGFTNISVESLKELLLPPQLSLINRAHLAS